MIFKEADSKEKQINELKRLLIESQSEKQKALIQKDLNLLQSGIESEQENTYYIDFYLKNNQNLIVLHDVRLEHNGRTAQVDHMIISRVGIELLESKSFKGTLTIQSDNSLQVEYNGKVVSYPNPLEQSKRHALVLQEFLNDYANLSKRIELLGGFEITSHVLINPKTTVANQKLPKDFYRADAFLTKRNEAFDQMNLFKVAKLLTKMITIDHVKEIASLLVEAHKPLNFSYEEKYRISKKHDEVTIETHKEDSSKLEVVEDVKINKPLQDDDACPFCGNRLVVRKNNKTNTEFLGCSSYPKCRFNRYLSSSHESVNVQNL